MPHHHPPFSGRLCRFGPATARRLGFPSSRGPGGRTPRRARSIPGDRRKATYRSSADYSGGPSKRDGVGASLVVIAKKRAPVMAREGSKVLVVALKSAVPLHVSSWRIGAPEGRKGRFLPCASRSKPSCSDAPRVRVLWDSVKSDAGRRFEVGKRRRSH
ncbi:hypothetical protein NL676_020852 [Syzygium grande]|nr:hypothetical protein NL676_020852 [Syzygium grande]